MDNTKKLMTAAAAALSLCACGKQEVKKPNVVFLLFDDLGYGDLGCYGQEKIETPNIDALASQGLLFTDMYSAAPLSAPSRCCLLTGSHMGHSQIRGNEEHYVPTDSLGWNGVFLNPDAQGQFPLEEGTQTLGTMLQSAGYKTAMVGKWGLGFPKSGSTPNTMGFDYFYGFNCQALAHSYYPVKLWENGVEVETGNDLVVQGCNFPDSLDKYDPANYEKYGGKHYSCDLMYDKMEKFVEENASSLFFLMWTTTVPHSAVQAPMDEVMHYVEKLGDEEPCTDPGMYLPNRYPLATYAAMVTHIDTQVGKLIGKLKELGVWDNTIFIVTSDNGPASNGNSPMEYFRSGGPFKCAKGWGKSSLHEGGIRMPFILRWGDSKKCEKITRISSFADIMPTLADIAGIAAPANDGISLAPTILAKTAGGKVYANANEVNAGEQKDHDFLYWEFPGAKGWVAVRKGEWKGLLKRVQKGNTEMELYNIVKDPRETTDVAAQHPEIVEEMWKAVKESHRDANPQVPKFCMDITYPQELSLDK